MLTTDEVKRVAKLAKLEVNSNELEKFRKLLSEALDYIKVLDELDTASVEPTSQVTNQTNVFHKDESARECLSLNEALLNAPKKENDLFVTDAVLPFTTFDV